MFEKTKSMKIISQRAQQLIRDILSQKESLGLIVESHPQMANALEIVLENIFPKSTINCLEGLYPSGNSLESHVGNGAYDFFVVGHPLSKWSSHKSPFGDSGIKVAKYIRSKKPNALIFFLSQDEKENSAALEEGWADIAVQKIDGGKIMDEINDLKGL